jgi:hypothetical protein
MHMKIRTCVDTPDETIAMTREHRTRWQAIQGRRR